MSNDKNQPTFSSIETVFANHQKALADFQNQYKGKKKASKRDLEFALAILLVELAGSDQQFDANEYNVIASGLKRMFGTDRIQVQALINQANLALADLRSSSQYGTLLLENLSLAQRQSILEIVEEVISADGKVDGFELFVRNKIAKLLDIPLDQLTK